ncbi:hypothetical protein EON79_08995 [bacterium]|nr:MAG: hypothetical protein EON79_08995 [bacterium]
MKTARRLFYPLLAVGVVCGLGGAVIYRFSGIPERKALAIEMKRARALGLPFTSEEMWGAPIPASHNAGPLYAQLLSHERQLERTRSAIRRLEATKDRAAMAATLKPVEADLALVERASMLPECQFKRTDGWDVVFKELMPMRTAVDLLSVRAGIEAEAGDPMRAMATLSHAARAVAHMGKERTLIAKLYQSDMEGSVLRGAQRVLTGFGHRADVREAARKLVRDFGPVPDFREGMRGEWYFQRQVFAGLDASKIKPSELVSGDSSETSAMTTILRTPVLRARQELVMVRIFLSAYESLPADNAQVMEALKVTATADNKIRTDDFDHTLANNFLAVFSGGPVSTGRALAARRSFVILTYALESSSPPRKLPVTGPEAIDPFTGKPLHYRATKKEVRVWSVGADGKDDGGLVKRTADAEDITALWPR